MLIAWLGFPQTQISYVKDARLSGVSKWTFSKRFKTGLLCWSQPQLQAA
jgi:hypothetical protein